MTMFSSRPIVVLVATVLVVLMPTTAFAQLTRMSPDTNFWDGRRALQVPTVTLGAVMDSGRGMYTKGGTDFTPTIVGYRYAERMGFISGIFLAGWLQILGVGGAAAAAAPRNTTSTTTTSRDYRPDGTVVVRETTTTTGTVTAEQGAQAQRTLDAGEAAAAGALTTLGQYMELVVYDDDWAGTDQGDGWGYRFTFMAPVYMGENAQWEVGWNVGNVIALDTENQVAVESYSFGFPVKFLYAFSYFWLSLQWDLNLSSFWNDGDRQERIEGVTYDVRETRPWPLTLELNAVLWRFNVFAGLTSSRPWEGDVGFRAGAGLRF